MSAEMDEAFRTVELGLGFILLAPDTLEEHGLALSALAEIRSALNESQAEVARLRGELDDVQGAVMEKFVVNERLRQVGLDFLALVEPQAHNWRAREWNEVYDRFRTALFLDQAPEHAMDCWCGHPDVSHKWDAARDYREWQCLACKLDGSAR